MEPNDPATLVRLGDTELEIGNTSEARARFEQALALDPQSAAAMDGLGKVASATGDVERAIELWKQALALQPGAGSLHYTLAQAYRRLGKIEDAEYHLARRGEAVVVLDDPVLEPSPRSARPFICSWRRAIGRWKTVATMPPRMPSSR